MTNMMDDIAHLSQEIGPRPAGTEEEQQAALYIADELQKSAGFSTIVEDVSCASNGNTVRAICFGLAFVCALLPIIFPVLSIPCFIIGLLAAALFACEVFGKPVLSRFLRSGVSQNVVAKYNPLSITNTNKRRKIILVTHYDSARVATEYQGIIGRYLPIIHNVCAITLAVAPLVLLIKTVFFASEAGGFAIVLLVLQIICVVLLALPLASIIKSRFSAYNDAANNDAAGVAVLLDVARTVGNGLVSNEEMEQHAREAGVEIHGEDAAYEAGVVPDGVEVTYQARENRMTPEESLAAAKAAIAALTGKPVADKVPLSDISSRLMVAWKIPQKKLQLQLYILRRKKRIRFVIRQATRKQQHLFQLQNPRKRPQLRLLKQPLNKILNNPLKCRNPLCANLLKRCNQEPLAWVAPIKSRFLHGLVLLKKRHMRTNPIWRARQMSRVLVLPTRLQRTWQMLHVSATLLPR